MDIKQKIKGVAKTTGKYTLKGLGKGVELLGRGGMKVVKALANNKSLQKIATAAGVLSASIAIPTVGTGLIMLLGMKYMINGALGKNKGIMQEIGDCLEMGTKVTRKASKKILNPVLDKVDRGMQKLGTKYQGKIDDIFK